MSSELRNEVKEQIVWSYEHGKTIYAIAKVCNVAESCVRKTLFRAGVWKPRKCVTAYCPSKQQIRLAKKQIRKTWKHAKKLEPYQDDPRTLAPAIRVYSRDLQPL